MGPERLWQEKVDNMDRKDRASSATYAEHNSAMLSDLLRSIGEGRVEGVAYDTAWIARLTPHYPGYGFDRSIEWLRRHQHADGTWGSPLLHYHDRFISTLAAIVALREVGSGWRDERRVKRGEAVLWHLVGKLRRDDSDTIGFPVLSVMLAQQATDLGLDVPRAPVRFAEPYRRKVQALLQQPRRSWVNSPLAFSLEGLMPAVRDDDEVLQANQSVGCSPAATAAYLMRYHNDGALAYLCQHMSGLENGATADVFPVNIFDTVWTTTYLVESGLVSVDDVRVRPILDFLWSEWSQEHGIGMSTYFPIPDVDETAASYVLLKMSGYPVKADPLSNFEMEDHFCCYPGETNPSVSAHIRLMCALRLADDHPSQTAWIEKTVNALRRFDNNGSYWWDKWHVSPYYANSVAVQVMDGIDDELAYSRFKWITRTQNDDGGWGYLDVSTAEETAYCLMALIWWDEHKYRVDSDILDAAASYLRQRQDSESFMPLWIGKTLYTPPNPVRAAVMSAVYKYDIRK